VYTPETTKVFERHVAAAALASGAKPMTGELDVIIHLFVEAARGTALADIDNYAKAVLDGLKAFFNDKNVETLYVKRVRVEKNMGAVFVEVNQYTERT
jgi:Holliday junction resolvase RusA-like endonuclease